MSYSPVPDSIIDLIKSSGNNFHSKTSKWLRDNGWDTEVSPYYVDYSQNKIREIDLIAEKIYPVKDVWGHTKSFFVVRLFVECKYISSDSIFWFSDKNKKRAENLVCSMDPFTPKNSYTSEHHYISSPNDVAKLYATNSAKSQENDVFYKAINQALNSMISMREKPLLGYQDIRGRPSFFLQYPVVICNSFERIYKTMLHGDETPERITQNFQMEIMYSYHDQNKNIKDEYMLIDFVSYENIDEFIESIEADARAASILSSG